MKRNAAALTYFYHVIMVYNEYKVKRSLLAEIKGSLFCSTQKEIAEKHKSLLIQSTNPQ